MLSTKSPAQLPHEEERVRAHTLEEEPEVKHSVTRFVERFKETEAQESIKSATTPPMGFGVEQFIRMLHTRVTDQPSLHADKPLFEILGAAREAWWYRVYKRNIKNFPSVELQPNPKDNVVVLYAAYDDTMLRTGLRLTTGVMATMIISMQRTTRSIS